MGMCLTVIIDRLARSFGDLQDIVRTLEGATAADRHEHGRWQVLPRYAGRVRRV